MKSLFDFKNRYYSKYWILIILRLRGAVKNAVLIKLLNSPKNSYILKQQFENLEEEGLISFVHSFNLKDPHMSCEIVVQLTTQGFELTNRYISFIIGLIVALITITGFILSLIKL